MKQRKAEILTYLAEIIAHVIFLMPSNIVNTKLQERERTKMASAPSFDEPWYISLLGLAENFRTSNPPNIRLCIHCLQSIFNFSPPPHIEARTHLQLGNILMTHTKNIDLARSHLEKAVGLTSFRVFLEKTQYQMERIRQSVSFCSVSDLQFYYKVICTFLITDRPTCNLSKLSFSVAVDDPICCILIGLDKGIVR